MGNNGFRNLLSSFSIVLSFILLGHDVIAQEVPITQIQANRTQSSIKLDGQLNDIAWISAMSLDSFMQASPSQGGRPSYKTDAKILYDNQFLYVGIKAYDSIGKYVVSGLQRDQYTRSEDGVSFMLDTYNDKIHSVQFYTNTVGVRYDAEINDNGSGLNAAFNTFWEVKTHILEDGYSVEFKIPFSSLRFQQHETTLMGFKIVRQIASKNEVDIYPPCGKNLGNVAYRVSSEGEIEFTQLKASTPVYLIPYLKSGFSKKYSLNNAGSAFTPQTEWFSSHHFSSNNTLDKILSSVGLDAKIGLSKNFTVDASINTDFAQAEVDNRIFNYTRYSIFLPEKRQFFLEANDYLNFELPGQIQLFNSRNIGIQRGKIIPIVGGIRLTGKTQGWQLGALNMQTQGLASEGISPENFSVLHLHKDLLGNGSYCSSFISNRRSTSDLSMNNQTYGADCLYRHNENWTWAFNLGATMDHDRKKFFDDNLVYNIAVFKTVTFGYSNFITYTYAGKNFTPKSGFYADNGFNMMNAVHSYTFKIKRKGFNYFDLSTNSYIKWNTRNIHGIETNIHSVIPSIGLKNGMDFRNEFKLYATDYLPFDWQFSDQILIPAKTYSLRGNVLTFVSPQTHTWLYKLTITGDQFYGGNRWAIQPEFSNVFNHRFTLGTLYLFTHIHFPSSFSAQAHSLFNSHLWILKMQYALNSKTSLNSLLQYDSDSESLGLNFRFRYNPKEGTDLYVVYNPGVQTNANRYTPVQPWIPQQIFIAKFAKTLAI